LILWSVFFQQTVGILIGTNCALLLADLLLYSREADFIYGLIEYREKKVDRSFIFTARFIDDVLSLTNLRFNDIIFIYIIYSIQLEMHRI
jgi:hypothetical protein